MYSPKHMDHKDLTSSLNLITNDSVLRPSHFDSGFSSF